MYLLWIIKFSCILLEFWNYYELLKWLLRKFISVIKYIRKLQFYHYMYKQQHNGGWKSSINLKLVIFTIPCSNAKLLFAINHSIFRVFQKFKMNSNSNFGSFILLVKFKSKKIHIYGLNCELGNIVNLF
jgi:hypothetical protein